LINWAGAAGKTPLLTDDSAGAGTSRNRWAGTSAKGLPGVCIEVIDEKEDADDAGERESLTAVYDESSAQPRTAAANKSGGGDGGGEGIGRAAGDPSFGGEAGAKLGAGGGGCSSSRCVGDGVEGSCFGRGQEQRVGGGGLCVGRAGGGGCGGAAEMSQLVVLAEDLERDTGAFPVMQRLLRNLRFRFSDPSPVSPVSCFHQSVTPPPLLCVPLHVPDGRADEDLTKNKKQ
jgi:hypothetical protein